MGLALRLACVFASFASSASWACGTFSFVDRDFRKPETVKFLVSSIRFPREPDDRVLLRLEAAQSRDRVFNAGAAKVEVTPTEVRVASRKLAREGSSITLEGTTWTIDVTRTADPRAHARFRLRILRGDAVFSDGSAMSFLEACQAESPCPDDARLPPEEDIRTRVLAYLVWKTWLQPK
ncbi:MAG: hypothetical protein JNJ54_32675 [Myxococcaceae bacterium]|nr:hypothetical protein [Myxococcaceae bacterium]